MFSIVNKIWVYVICKSLHYFFMQIPKSPNFLELGMHFTLHFFAETREKMFNFIILKCFHLKQSPVFLVLLVSTF